MWRRSIVAVGLVGLSLAATPADARLREDAVPNAEAAKEVGTAYLRAYLSPKLWQSEWKDKFVIAKLKGGTWFVNFEENDPLAPEPVPKPDEIIVTIDCGGCAYLEISKRDGRLRRLQLSK